MRGLKAVSSDVEFRQRRAQGRGPLDRERLSLLALRVLEKSPVAHVLSLRQRAQKIPVVALDGRGDRNPLPRQEVEHLQFEAKVAFALDVVFGVEIDAKDICAG